MGKRTQLLVAIIFVAVIFAPLIVGTTTGYQAREIENRGLTEFPALGAIFSDPKFLDRVKEALGDHLPLRAEMVRRGAWLDMTLFDHSYNPTVSLGRDDWLFLKKDVYALKTDPIPPMADGIKRMGDALAGLGIRFLFTIVPNKSAIYPEKLRPLLARANEAGSARRAKMQRLLEERAAPYFVDLWGDLLAAKLATPRPLYLSLDTHWTHTGAAIAAKTVVNRLHPGLWDDTALVVSPPVLRLGDLSHIQGFDRYERAQMVETSRPGVVVTQTQPLSGDFAKDSRSYKATSSGPYLIPGHTVMLYDSFFERAMDLVAPYFEEITFIHEHLRERTETFELIARSDILIVALVERTVGGVGWFYDPDYQSKIEEAVQQSVALRR
jgi:hypothetical protein